MSRTRVAVITLFAVASAIAAACGSFSGSDQSVGADSGTNQDATTEAGSGLHFCQMQDAEYCTDFDTPSLLYAPFVPYTTVDASLAATDAGAVSPPTALVAVAVPSVQNADPLGEAVIGLQAVSLGTGRQIELDIRVLDPKTGGIVVQLYGVQADGGLSSGGFVVTGVNGGVYAASFYLDGGEVGSQGIVSSAQDNPPMHLRIELTPVDGGATFLVHATISGKALDQPAPVLVPGVFTDMRIAVGAQASLNSPPFRVELDNVVVR